MTLEPKSQARVGRPDWRIFNELIPTVSTVISKAKPSIVTKSFGPNNA